MLARIGVQFGNSSQLPPVLRVREAFARRFCAIADNNRVTIKGFDRLKLQASEDVEGPLQFRRS
jgi:hypothetical protein